MIRLWVGANPDPWDCTVCRKTVDGTAPERGRGLLCETCRDTWPGLVGDRYIPLTIQPRRLTKPDERPVIAVNMRDRTAVTEDGEILTLEQLAVLLEPRTVDDNRGGEWRPQLPPSILVTDNSRDLLGWADHLFSGRNDTFNWCVKLLPQTPCPAGHDELTALERAREVPDRFGWASRRGRPGEPGFRRAPEGRSRWYQIISPRDFSGAVRNLVAGHDLRAMLRFGVELRGYCNTEGLRVTSNAMALASQFMRDRRFWPDRRRKMPAADNLRAREHLPGNLYRLLAPDLVKHPQVRKVDITGAHHQMAMRTQFPLVDTFRARGEFKHPPAAGTDATTVTTPMMGAPRWDEHGMFCIRLRTGPHLAADMLQPPYFRDEGHRVRFVFSNELPHIREHERAGRCEIVGAYAQWTSSDVDDGLNEYAHHALARMQTLERGTMLREWTKAMFHSLYGQLAARPRRHGSVWHHGTGERRRAIGSRYGHMFGHDSITKHARENPTTCVIWRCLIEARQRHETLAAARQLRDNGARILNVHADALFYEHPESLLGLLAGYWRDEGVLSNVTFHSSTHYQSDQEDRFPGVSRHLRRAERRQIAASAKLRAGPDGWARNDGAHLEAFASGRSRDQFTDAVCPTPETFTAGVPW